MSDQKTDNKKAFEVVKLSSIPIESKIHLLFMALLSISFIGFWMFWSQQREIGLIFAHIAALGIMGFYGSWAGALAKKKGYGFWKAFNIGFFTPITIGVISAVLFSLKGEGDILIICPGWEVLGTGIVVVGVYFFIKRKPSGFDIK